MNDDNNDTSCLQIIETIVEVADINHGNDNLSTYKIICSKPMISVLVALLILI